MILTNKFSKLKWWQIAIGALVVSAIGGLASLQSSKKDRSLYTEKLKQAQWAPPGWVFGPAWFINNFFILLALQHLTTYYSTDQKKLLALQAGIWAIYFSFGYVYFNKKSTTLAATWTVLDFAFAIMSFRLACRNSRKLSMFYLPLVMWTAFASSLALYQALNNKDLLFEDRS